MHILWNNHRDISNPEAGGAERSLHEIAKRLASRGHSVTLLTSKYPGASPRDTINGVRVYRFSGTFGPHVNLAPFLTAHPEIDIIVDDLAHVVPWYSPWLGRRRGVAFFRHLHRRTLPGQVSFFGRLALESIERSYPYIYRRWPFVTESLSSVSDLIELGISPSVIFRIPPGVDSNAYTPRTKTAFPQIAYIGGMRRYKRPEHAVLAFRVVKQSIPDARMVMTGSGPALPQVQQLVTRFGLSESILLTGRVEPDRLAGLLGESWVHVQTSVAEGWCLAAIEAAACGVPTVAYRVPGLSESVNEGKSGTLVADRDTNALAVALQRTILQSRNWSASCQEWSRRFDWETVASSWERMLRSVCDMKGLTGAGSNS